MATIWCSFLNPEQTALTYADWLYKMLYNGSVTKQKLHVADPQQVTVDSRVPTRLKFIEVNGLQLQRMSKILWYKYTFNTTQ